jgi:hypothetical protein
LISFLSGEGEFPRVQKARTGNNKKKSKKQKNKKNKKQKQKRQKIKKIKEEVGYEGSCKKTMGTLQIFEGRRP